MTDSLTNTPEVRKLLHRAAGLDQPGGDARLKRIVHRVATDMCRIVEDLLDDVGPARAGRDHMPLTAAGFEMRSADTPEKQAQLATLPPHRLLAQRNDASGTPQLGYIYADPEGCHCAFVGDARAYQAFQQLAMQKRIADEHLATAR